MARAMGRPRPAPSPERRDASRTTQSVAAVETRLTAERTQALRSFAAAHEVTLNTLLQGAWALLLQVGFELVAAHFSATVAALDLAPAQARHIGTFEEVADSFIAGNSSIEGFGCRPNGLITADEVV
jgi:hypothetical protein